MRPGDSVLPLYYGNPKIHKENIPLRPIISFCGSSTYKLAKELSKRLQTLTENSQHMLKNSTDFINRIKDLVIDDDEVMVYFDVKSLCTCILLDSALERVSEIYDSDDSFQVSERWPKQ